VRNDLKMAVPAVKMNDIMSLLENVHQGIITLDNFTPTVEIIIRSILDLQDEHDMASKITIVSSCMHVLCQKAPANIRGLLEDMIELSLPFLVPALDHLLQAKAKLSAMGKPKKATSALGHKFCCKKNTEDSRDVVLKIDFMNSPLPPRIDLRETGNMPAVMDQGSLGSCTAQGTSCCLQYCLKKEKIDDCVPSRLYMYYVTRVNIEHESPSNDSGCQIRDVMKAVAKYHVCHEELMPYDITKYDQPPSGVAVANANLHMKFQYLYVKHDEMMIKRALNAGFPIIFGLQIFEGFESPDAIKTGIVNMPDQAKERLLGGHCMTMIGFDDEKKHFIVRNSWGEAAGDKGDFYIAYEYMLSPLASDFWTIKFFQCDD